MGYLLIFLTIVLTVYGQMILKWRLNQLGTLPDLFFDKLFFLLRALFDPFIFSSFLSAFVASLCWMAALKEFDLSKVYPFMGLSFIFVLWLGHYLLHEPVDGWKIIGTILVVAGVLIISRSA